MFINDCTTGILTGDFGAQRWLQSLISSPQAKKSLGFYFTRNTSSYSGGYINKISTCTLTLDDIANAPISDSKKKEFEAEVRCARAFLAYTLYDMYGPLVIAPLEVLKNPYKSNHYPVCQEKSR